MPEDRVAALRKAFVEMFDDPEFKKDVAANKTDADAAKIERWNEDLQKINQQIATLRKITKKG